MGGPLSKLCVTPPFSINFRCQIENQVSDYRLLRASSFHKGLFIYCTFHDGKIQENTSSHFFVFVMGRNKKIHPHTSLYSCMTVSIINYVHIKPYVVKISLNLQFIQFKIMETCLLIPSLTKTYYKNKKDVFVFDLRY